MAVVTFDPAKLPAVPTTPAKHDEATLKQYIAAIDGERAAGDGVKYADQKAAKSAAQSIKRGLNRFGYNKSVKMRLWSIQEKDDKGNPVTLWQFALMFNPISNAPKNA